MIMFINICLAGIMLTSFVMASSKRINALVSWFQVQSIALFLLIMAIAYKETSVELYTVAVILFVVKVLAIPRFIKKVVGKIRVNQDLGLLANPAVSVFISLGLTFLAYFFSAKLISIQGKLENAAFFISMSVILIGVFLMIFRMKAIAQIVGLLVTENGLFLAAASVSGGMPFIVEIAIFFDIFLCVIILGMFVYRINKLFTHIDINRLTELKG